MNAESTRYIRYSGYFWTLSIFLALSDIIDILDIECFCYLFGNIIFTEVLIFEC